MTTAVELRAPARPTRLSPAASRTWVVAGLGVVCATTFFGVHTWLRTRGWTHDVARLQGAGAMPAPVRGAPVFGSFRSVLADSGAVYLAFLVAGLALARNRCRAVIALPLACWMLGPLVVRLLGGASGPGSLVPVAPMPVGTEWISLSSTGRASDLWLGAAVDAGLVLLPAVALAWFVDSAAQTTTRRFLSTPSRVAATGLGVFALLLIVQLPRLYGVPETGFASELVPYAALFAFGAALDDRWRWRWPVVICVATLATNNFAQWAVFHAAGSVASVARAVLPFAAAAAAGAAITPMARVFERLETRPIEALIACNALNIADALLTAIGIRGGLAVETNPVVRLIGLPAKVLLVGLLSIALVRTRPRALIWPCAALTAVVVWHLAGLLAETPLAWWPS